MQQMEKTEKVLDHEHFSFPSNLIGNQRSSLAITAHVLLNPRGLDMDFYEKLAGNE